LELFMLYSVRWRFSVWKLIKTAAQAVEPALQHARWISMFRKISVELNALSVVNAVRSAHHPAYMYQYAD